MTSSTQRSRPYNIWQDDERLKFLARVATMYYEEGQTQSEISVKLGYSRSAISRFLTDARDLGVVEIRINYPTVRNTELEDDLKATFGLHEARVLVRGGVLYQKMLQNLGQLASEIIVNVVDSGSVIGTSWGTAVYEVARAINPPRLQNIQVVQLIGALGAPEPRIDGPELVQYMARKFGGRYRSLHAPLIVGSEELRDGLIWDKPVREVMDLAKTVKIAVVGIGTVDPDWSSLLRANQLTAEELASVAESGAVGDVCGIHFDLHGNILDIPLAKRTVGVSAETLAEVPYVVGVAGGLAKVNAIHGALCTGIVNTLVTDDVTAATVLEVHQTETE